MVLPNQRQGPVHDEGVGQSKRGGPVRAVGPDEHSRARRIQHIGDDPGLFDQLAASSSPRRLPGMHPPTRAHPTPPPMLNQQHLAKVLIERPHLGGDGRHRLIPHGPEPRTGIVEFVLSHAGVVGCCTHRELVKIGSSHGHRLRPRALSSRVISVLLGFDLA